MIQTLLLKAIIDGVMKHIEKASDKRIAKTHDRKIKELDKRVKKLERQKK
ncbi:MAG: hypothetical protein Tp1124DCM412261_1 [Prokaryotic dsDNA virus sp.]|nr:MAG: hypothetical protein Tp1123DCM939791_33 [Prokaryotic dsDNA virus sp.]QDP59833.1 MAG: hypothetical protein Tp1124DCM412261_1 [Prokaryotic dsDNA virus sp.]|tara:strand:- start:2991 stop:3140 length:150 start_codon:yes stop_codon:yes gene_type:complete